MKGWGALIGCEPVFLGLTSLEDFFWGDMTELYEDKLLYSAFKKEYKEKYIKYLNRVFNY